MLRRSVYRKSKIEQTISKDLSRFKHRTGIVFISLLSIPKKWPESETDLWLYVHKIFFVIQNSNLDKI